MEITERMLQRGRAMLALLPGISYGEEELIIVGAYRAMENERTGTTVEVTRRQEKAILAVSPSKNWCRELYAAADAAR